MGFLETRDLDEAVGYLAARRDVDPRQIGAMGFSLSAAAFLLADHQKLSRNLRAIVADSPYARLEDVLQRQYALFPGFTK